MSHKSNPPQYCQHCGHTMSFHRAGTPHNCPEYPQGSMMRSGWLQTSFTPPKLLNIHELMARFMEEELQPCSTSVNPEEGRFAGFAYTAEMQEGGVQIGGTMWGGKAMRRAVLVSLAEADPEFMAVLFEAAALVAQRYSGPPAEAHQKFPPGGTASGRIIELPGAGKLILPPGIELPKS